jgi:GDP-L-fucose synthase
VAGHRGMVGSAIMRALQNHQDNQIIVKNRSELDLLDQRSVRSFFEMERPTEVYLAAARVGGIHANNQFPAEFIYQNLMIEANIIHEAWRAGVNKLMFLGSSCIYPKFAEQPIIEDSLLTGQLEPTNEPYAIAKIAGIKLCESYNRQYGKEGIDYRSIMPTNLYGPGDNYHPTNSHVIPGLLRRFHEAKIKKADHVTVWGSGKPKREFLFVDDLALAAIHVMDLPPELYQQITSPMMSHINVGYGEDQSIYDLAHLVKDTVGYEGEIIFDKSYPDGTPRKLLNSDKLRNTGWAPKTTLRAGLEIAYQKFLEENPED